MIIRVTVNDNDYYYILLHFMESMWDFKKKSSEDVQVEVERRLKHEKILQLISPNNTKKLTPREEGLIIDYLREKFEDYIDSRVKNSRTRELLKRDIKIGIQRTFIDEWENGEAFYWLQHSQKIVNQ